jgi:serpin B
MTMHVTSRRLPSQSRASLLGGAQWLLERLEARTLFSAAPTLTPADVVAQSDNAFAFDLFHELSQTNTGNLFFSPYSAATALEMALQGARGTTATEMIQALHLPSSDIAQAGIAALYQLFQSNPQSDGDTLSTANRLWVSDNFSLLASFITNVQNTFGAGPQSVDFSNPDAAAKTIDDWVSAQTNGKIPDLIKSSQLNDLTRLVLTNAIYFKGSWASPFNADLTHAASFQIDSTDASTVQMMEQTSPFGYYAQSGPNGFQALDLPYSAAATPSGVFSTVPAPSSDLDMVVILPTASNLANFQSTLTPDVFNQITSNLSTTKVNVDLPKFKLNETYDLVDPLKALGIHTAFTQQADFSGISSSPLQITDVIQKTFINVDETGTEAAAATALMMGPNAVVALPSPQVTFNADHPFIIAIRDRATNTILFLGSVTDPANGSTTEVTAPGAPTDPVDPAAPPTPFIAAADTLHAPAGSVSTAPAATQTSSNTSSDLLDGAVNSLIATAGDVI